MNKNKLTLLIDGNWLLMSRMSVLVKKFDKNNPNPVKQEASNEFETLLAKSLNVIRKKIKTILIAISNLFGLSRVVIKRIIALATIS